MVRFFQERFFAVRRHRGPAAPRGGDRVVNPRAGHARALDVLRRPRPDRGQHRRGRGARADRARLRRPRARRHRLGARLRRGGAAAARRDRGRSCAAGSRPSCSTPPARSTCPAASTASTRSTPPTTRCRWPTGPRTRARCASGSRPATSAPRTVIDAILTSTARALDRPQHVVIAHFVSILPKIGLTEADVPARGARAARRRGRADRPGDRDLRALALPVGRHAAPVPAPRRPDRALDRQPQARDDRPLRRTASRCARELAAG